MSKTKMILMPLTVLSFALANAVAQAPAGDEPGPPPPVRVVVGFLELTTEQTQGLLEGIRDSRIELTPVAAQLEGLEKALEELLEDESPPEEAVGSLVLQIRELKREAGEIHRSFVERFADTLEEEQRARLSFVHQAAHIQQLLPAFGAVGLLP